MNFNNLFWNKDLYKKYLNYLISIKEDKYQVFSSKLTKTKYKILGIRIPILRSIAKNILKSDIISFLENNTSTYLEEVMIYGLVIANIKDNNIFNKYFYKYLDLIDNWALADTFCSSLKKFKKDNKYFIECLNLLNSNKEYYIRVGIVSILDYYITNDNLNLIFKNINNIKVDTYYVNMAISWLLCEIFINFKEETIKYLETCKLNDFIINKAIQKIRESYRVSKYDKEYLLKFKRKDNIYGN